MFELNPIMEFVIVMICIGGAAFAQSTLGFGYAVLLVPVLTLFLDARSAIALTQLIGLAVSVTSYVEYRPRTKIRSVSLIAITAVITTPVGAWVLLQGSEQLILICVGLGIGITALGNYLRSQMSTTPHAEFWAFQVTAGFFSGLLRGSVSMPGPPVIIYQHWIGGGAENIRSRMFAYMLAMAVPTTLLLLIMGVFTAQTLIYTIPGVVAVIIGNYISQRVRPHMSESLFKFCSMLLLLVSASALIVRSITL